MDGRTFDEVARSLGAATDRRGVLKGAAAAALAGAFGLAGFGSARAGRAVACNSNEKCEAKCGRETAVCCNGRCVRGCGPNRTMHSRTCQCVRVTDGGTYTTGPFFCGA